jgi:hypothetical protein
MNKGQTDITGDMRDYRDSLTLLWNGQFRRRFRSLFDCGPLDQFEQIDGLLFRGLVLDGHSPSCSEGGKTVGISVTTVAETACMPGALIDGYFQWLEARPLHRELIGAMEFEELFDFDRYAELSLEFVKCKVAASSSHQSG